MLVTAESCTGGLVAAAMTDRAGSSAVFERGFITYSNQAKMECLDVQEATLIKYGAVSHETAREMALGALNKSAAQIAISITGIAGPGGGSDEKPAGLVYVGCAIKGEQASSYEFRFTGSRKDIRQKSTEEALKTAIKALENL